jgi:hypothetical protein
VKQVEEILFPTKGNALRADRFARQGMVRVKQRLRRRVPDHVDARLTMLHEI